MSKTKIGVIVALALTGALVLGSIGIASAATTTAAGTGVGFRMGTVMRNAGASLADVVAKLTGKTEADVYAERAAGKSFATIAGEKGVSADKVAAEALAARKVALASAVKSGQLTQAQADAMTARMATQVPTRINAAAPAGCTGAGPGSGAGAGAGRGMGGGRGAGAGGCGGAGCGVTQP